MDRSAEKLAALKNAWDLYCSISARKGLDIAASCTKWSEQKRQSLQHESSKSFDDLCNHGCKELPLAILMAIIKPLKTFEKQWTKITGATKQRKQKIRTIEKAAVVLQDVLGSLPGLPTADDRRSMDVNSLKELQLELIVLHPSITVYALTTYASILDMFEAARKRTSVDSSEMLSKYLFSAYAYRATSRFHDKEVSDLIGNALGITYDETAHRMWRNRNYKRIDKRLSGIADILVDFGKVSIT